MLRPKTTAVASVRPFSYRVNATLVEKEDREGKTAGSINKSGDFQTTNFEGLELHVKDSVRFKGGWAFFAFDSMKPAAQISMNVACYTCHRAHAAVDTTFVQFYPTLIELARAKGTLSANYRKENP